MVCFIPAAMAQEADPDKDKIIVEELSHYTRENPQFGRTETDALVQRLDQCPYKIVYQTRRGDNWELFIMDADGDNKRNLTNTPDIDEFYPQASPDGRLIAFEVDDKSTGTMGDIYVVNVDGTGRRLVVRNAVQPAWNPDGRTIACKRMNESDPEDEDQGLMFVDLETGAVRIHPERELRKMHNLTYTKDGRWIFAVINAALGWGQAIIAVEVDGDRIYPLIHQSRDLPPNPETNQYLMGCRPDVSHDGRRVTWCIEEKHTRMWIGVADLEFAADGAPAAVNRRWAVTDSMQPTPWEIYHSDWSPDDRLIAFSKGVRGPLMERARYSVRQEAPGWNIYVCDPDNPGPYVPITRDGQSNKEPEWIVGCFR
jgi:Tol biopolymer transport system component